MPQPNSFSTLSELLDYVEQHASEIYIRTEVNGVVGNYVLAELPAILAIRWFTELIRSGRLPYRIVTKKESDAPTD